MLNRKLSIISSTIGDLLVKQIAHELKNRNLYLSFANYFSIEGYTSLENYYIKRAAEEDLHHTWISEYLADGDYSYIYPLIDINTEKFEDCITPFKQTIEREIQTTQLIYNIYEAAISEKDYMTASWLYKKLIQEQIEEENISRMALSIMESEGNNFVKGDKILELL